MTPTKGYFHFICWFMVTRTLAVFSPIMTGVKLKGICMVPRPLIVIVGRFCNSLKVCMLPDSIRSTVTLMASFRGFLKVTVPLAVPLSAHEMVMGSASAGSSPLPVSC